MIGKKYFPIGIINSLLVIVPLCMTFLIGCQSSPPNQKPDYGSKTRYVQGLKQEYPDFTLEFMGERRESDLRFPPGFRYFDFKITHGAQEQVISWSSGTGDIGPARFEVGGSQFLLERSYSDTLGRLKEDELVIWKLGK